jgi:hypothetical protein
MNTDYLVENAKIREQRLQDKLTCRGEKHFNCNKVNQYASDQNTVYDPMKNLMLYGINSNMGVLGVSDGTCNQINPLIYTDPYKCGFGAAGANPCVPDAYGIENFEASSNGEYGNTNNYIFLFIVILIIILFYKKYNK